MDRRLKNLKAAEKHIGIALLELSKIAGGDFSPIGGWGDVRRLITAKQIVANTHRALQRVLARKKENGHE